MYYLAKIAQATGLTIILLGYVSSLPGLMSRKVLMTGIIVFFFGWMIQKILLKN